MPKTTKDVSEILKYCNDKSIAVCPQAGNTGMSGGGVALFDEVVLSTRRMNDVIHFDPVSGKLVSGFIITVYLSVRIIIIFVVVSRCIYRLCQILSASGSLVYSFPSHH